MTVRDRLDPVDASRKPRWRHVSIMLVLGAFGIGTALAASSRDDGANIFQARCAKCHGESGKSDTTSARALKVRPLVNDSELARMAPGDIASHIRSNPKHNVIGAPVDADPAELEAVAVFVRNLARKRGDDR